MQAGRQACLHDTGVQALVIPARIGAKIHIAGGRRARKHVLCNGLVRRAGRADKPVIADGQCRVEGRKHRHDLVAEVLGRDAPRSGGRCNFLAVLVGAREEINLWTWRARGMF